MTVQQIQALGPALSKYLDEFADCFVKGSVEPGHNQVFSVQRVSGGADRDNPSCGLQPVVCGADAGG
jgi:hypothetical protein